MYCSHCGKEIDSDASFCPFCGEKNENAGKSSINDMIDNAGEEIGSGIEDAVNEFKESFKDASETISKKMEDADGHKKDWKEYLTKENLEKLAALSLLLPLFMGVVNVVVSRVFFGLSFFPLVGYVFGIVPSLVRLIFVLVSLCGVAATAYILYEDESKRNTWTYILLGCNVLAAISCIGVMFYWSKALRFIFGLISLVYGIDAVSRVIVQNKGFESQPDVSKDLNAYKDWYENYKKEHASEESTELATADNGPKSYFDGKGSTLFGLYLLTFLLTCVTCGLAAPWMICKVFRWRKSHTVIDGRRLSFNGTGGSLFGHWLLWELLTVVTCGIYSFFMHVALRRWEMQHTTYEDEPAGAGQFDGNSFQYFGYALLETVLLMLTCCLAAPWTITLIEKWEMKHSVIINGRMKYEGTALGLLGQYIIVLILTVITLGIYSPWGTVRINKYIYSHTHVDK